MQEGCCNKITFDYLRSVGWEEKSGIMVRFSAPRIGWKKDGTLIIGYHEFPEKIFEIDLLHKLIG